MRAIENFEIMPLKHYQLPKYPSYEDAKTEPSLLRRLPNRWKKNMAALACVGLLGMATTLGGCFGASCNIPLPPTPSTPAYPNGNDNGNNGNNSNGGGYENGNEDLCIADIIASGISAHHGGSGGPPVYVVYLTEQEALQVIRYKAESLGLSMRSTPPSISVVARQNEHQWALTREIGVGLFNAEKNIALSHVGGSNWWDWEWSNRQVAQNAQALFNEKDGDMTIKVFHGVSEWAGSPIAWNEETRAPVFPQERLIETTQTLKQHLKAQVREFIEWLQAGGIIQ